MRYHVAGMEERGWDFRMAWTDGVRDEYDYRNASASTNQSVLLFKYLVIKIKICGSILDRESLPTPHASFSSIGIFIYFFCQIDIK